MIVRDAVVNEARRWDGVRWVHQGRTEHGIDCVGLIVVVCRALGIWDYDVADYPRDPDGTFMAHFFKAGGTRIPILSVQRGDLLLYRGGVFACHVAFVSERQGVQTLIHAHASRRKVVEEPLVGEWRQHWVAGIALPGVGD